MLQQVIRGPTFCSLFEIKTFGGPMERAGWHMCQSLSSVLELEGMEYKNTAEQKSKLFPPLKTLTKCTFHHCAVCSLPTQPHRPVV